jgi:hypothetical protein
VQALFLRRRVAAVSVARVDLVHDVSDLLNCRCLSNVSDLMSRSRQGISCRPTLLSVNNSSANVCSERPPCVADALVSLLANRLNRIPSLGIGSRLDSCRKVSRF